MPTNRPIPISGSNVLLLTIRQTCTIAIKKIIEIAEYPAIFILRIKNSAGERVIRDAPSGRSLVPNRSINSEAYSKTKPKIAKAISR